MHDVTIYHNPACSKSRSTLDLIRKAGIEPRIIEYLREPPTREQLAGLILAAGLAVRDALRAGEAPFQALALDRPDLADDVLLDAMVAHPILMERPFVTTPYGTRLCRPPERVLEILAES
jgi:arsenate reductase